MNPGSKFTDWYGRCLAVKTDDPNITFKQVSVIAESALSQLQLHSLHKDIKLSPLTEGLRSVWNGAMRYCVEYEHWA